MSSPYPILDNRPIDQWKVTELKEELKRRKLTTKGLKDDLIKRLDEAIHTEIENAKENADKDFVCDSQSEVQSKDPRTVSVVAGNAETIDIIDRGEDINVHMDGDLLQVDIDDSRGLLDGDKVLEGELVGGSDSAGVVGQQVGEATSLETIVAVTESVVSEIALSGLQNNDIKNESGNSEALILSEDSVSLQVDTKLNLSDPNNQVSKVSPVGGSDSAGVVGQQVGEATSVETIVAVTESVVSEIALSGLQNNDIKNESGNSEALLLSEDSESLQVDTKLNSSDPNNQVSKVSPVLGFQVKSDSISSDSFSINAKNELKDNVIADDVKLELDVKDEMVQPSSINFIPDGGKSHPMDVEEEPQGKVYAEEANDGDARNELKDSIVVDDAKLELDVKHEMVQPPSSNVVPDGGKSHPMDVEEPHENKVYAEETSDNNAENAVMCKKNDSGDVGSSEKLNLDRSSGEDSMEEDILESKQIDSKLNSDEVVDRVGKIEVSLVNEEGPVDVVGEDLPVGKENADVESKKDLAAPSVKRKLNDEQILSNNETTKRQRRWNSEGLRVPEPQSSNIAASTTPKDALQPTAKRNFSRSNSALSNEKPKERVVPPSSKSPTNSLRIDRFLRPFTLKAVQDLLGKTGTVTSFWMDHIKTHCYVTYSSVEEAVETRNAVYDLQWPTNGGRQLVAEYIDPQEVKIRAEAPLPSPVTPVSSGPSIPPPPLTVHPQPSPRQQVQRQQLPPAPPLPPPPPLANPPPARERITLPPPPPLPEKVDPPIVTLDDLFKKTKATPRVYYLPLSDEQVAAKLRAEGKNGNQ